MGNTDNDGESENRAALIKELIHCREGVQTIPDFEDDVSDLIYLIACYR